METLEEHVDFVRRTMRTPPRTDACDLMPWLGDFIGRPVSATDDEADFFLNMLCRKLCVAKALYQHYTPFWQMPVDRTAADNMAWLAAAVVLTRYADHSSTADCKAFKFVNAAFYAAERVQPVAEGDGIRSLLHTIVARRMAGHAEP